MEVKSINLSEEQIEELKSYNKAKLVQETWITLITILFSIAVVVGSTVAACWFNDKNLMWLYLMAFVAYMMG